MFDKSLIRVYNYGRSGVSLPARDRSVFLSGAEDPNYPVMETFTFSDLEYMNTHSAAIRSGIVEFAEEEREEIYNELHLRNWADVCFFEREIDDLLLNANFNTMERVLSVTDISTIDRIYSHLMGLIKNGTSDVSTRVQKVVEERRKELYSDVLTSRIRLVQKKEEKTFSEQDVADMVAKQVAEQMAALKKEAEVQAPAAQKVAEVKKAPVKKPAAKTTTKKPAARKTAAPKKETEDTTASDK